MDFEKHVISELAEIKGHLKTLNGTVGNNTSNIAVLKSKDKIWTKLYAGAVAGLFGLSCTLITLLIKK